MGEEKNLRGLRNLGGRNFLTLVSKMMRMHKEEGRGPNSAFLYLYTRNHPGRQINAFSQSGESTVAIVQENLRLR